MQDLRDRLDINHLNSEVGLGLQPVCLLIYMVMDALTVRKRSFETNSLQSLEYQNISCKFKIS